MSSILAVPADSDMPATLIAPSQFTPLVYRAIDVLTTPRKKQAANQLGTQKEPGPSGITANRSSQ